MEQGLFTSVDLTRAYIARIDEIDKDFRAVIEINPDALEMATALDKERAESKVRGPMHGIRILLKMTNFPRGAAAVARVREKGAVLLGKADMSHSSGSVVATAMGLEAAALATETHGSVISRRPNSRVWSESSPPSPRRPRDAARLLQPMVGRDPRDKYTSAIPFEEAKTPNYEADASGCPRAFQHTRNGSRHQSMEYLKQRKASSSSQTFLTALPKFLAEMTVDVTLDRQGVRKRGTPAGGKAALVENLRLGTIERNRLDALVLLTSVVPQHGHHRRRAHRTMPIGYLQPGTSVEKNPGRIGLVLKAPNIPFGKAFMGARFTEEKLTGLAFLYEQ
ncbi:hypothetical protein MAPG_04214 [Magnaporthiopsis poae ATCC 64411]|uniref:Amidase domain-containing protein n=1 Tax=Magnaporthiopsis poae (strain ATCC 64411 / 73-15) TaxID=644358 RepID=A0A0C4DW42_MAGP6|nr:hypothetical protein MAPG_04214 [Magnaporthiopsis poae ATCC 64411]